MSETRPEPPPRPPEATPPKLRVVPLVVWIGLGALLVALWLGLRDGPGTELSYSEFKAKVGEGAVARVVVSEHDIEGQLAENDERFHTVRVEDPQLEPELEKAGVEVTGEAPSTGLGLLALALPWVVLPLLLGIAIWRGVARMNKAGMGFAKSPAKLLRQTTSSVDFDDVAGCDEAKAELQEVVDFLKDPSRYEALGARIPKGVLLVGPPGTGKTLLARAVAGEAKVAFFSLSGSDFVEMFVGVGAARVRDLFEQASRRAPCIVFIDELDAIGRRRGIHLGVVNDEREQTLNQLLVELDGFEPNSGVILLSATNRPDVLDPALLRPGRFDRQVVLDAPDRAGRLAILRVHTRDKAMKDGVDLERVARATPGFSGADLANAMNEAALAAVRRAAKAIESCDLDEAVEKVIAGPERRSRRLGPEEKRRVAIHEVGHALVAHFNGARDPVQKISIVPRGKAALGYTLQIPDEDRFLVTRGELTLRLEVLLAGRAAEELCLGEPSTGSEDDLAKATLLARRMVALLGMGERTGLARCAHTGEELQLEHELATSQRDCSDATAKAIDDEVERLLQSAHAAARHRLGSQRAALDRVVEVLLEREVIDRETFLHLVNDSLRAAG